MTHPFLGFGSSPTHAENGQSDSPSCHSPGFFLLSSNDGAIAQQKDARHPIDFRSDKFMKLSFDSEFVVITKKKV
jgi:hypothetical protein